MNGCVGFTRDRLQVLSASSNLKRCLIAQLYLAVGLKDAQSEGNSFSFGIRYRRFVPTLVSLLWSLQALTTSFTPRSSFFL